MLITGYILSGLALLVSIAGCIIFTKTEFYWTGRLIAAGGQCLGVIALTFFAIFFFV